MTISNAYADQLKIIADDNGVDENDLETQLKSAFAAVDKNNDGSITADEAAQWGISADYFKAYAGSDMKGSFDEFIKWNLDNYQRDPNMYKGFFQKGVKSSDIEENAPDAMQMLQKLFSPIKHS